jgi:hypothetical protein
MQGLLGGGRHPIRRGGLQLWLRSDAGVLNASLAQAADTDPIQRWDDRAGRDHLFEQGTAAARPTFRTGVINGLPVVRCDGTDDLLVRNPLDAFNVQSKTVVAVAARGTGTGIRVIVGSGANWYCGVSTSVVRASYTDGGAAQVVADSASGIWGTSTWGLAVYQWDVAGSDVRVRIWFNGALVVDTTSATGYGNVSPNFGVGGRGPGANYWDGDIAEVAVYDRGLSDAERQRIERHLATRYGITL